MTDKPDIPGFIGELLNEWAERDWMDIDGGDFQDLMIKHGIAFEKPASAEDAATDWASEYDICEGDLILGYPPEIAAMKKAAS